MPQVCHVNRAQWLTIKPARTHNHLELYSDSFTKNGAFTINQCLHYQPLSRFGISTRLNTETRCLQGLCHKADRHKTIFYKLVYIAFLVVPCLLLTLSKFRFAWIRFGESRCTWMEWAPCAPFDFPPYLAEFPFDRRW